MNYKRHKPKGSICSDGYAEWRANGNHSDRYRERDIRQPQMYEYDARRPIRYLNKHIIAHDNWD